MEKKKKGRGNRILLFAVLIAAAVLLAGLLSSMAEEPDDSEHEPPEPKIEEPIPEPIELSILSVGDVMVHKSQIPSQYDSATGTYDYRDNFRFVKPYIEAVDVAMCNVETTFAGGTPSGYPSFNAPDALAEALADAGFSVGITSNNHLFDKGQGGMDRTLSVLRDVGMTTAGTRLEGEEDFALVEAKGVQIGIVAYTYETPAPDEGKRINGIAIPDTAAARINSFSYDTLDADLLKIGASISKAREAGADIVVCYYHWGEEYQRTPNLWQYRIAEETADLGADIIFASHPHVLQGAEWIRGPVSGKEIPVFFSMGNFISNQRAETLNNRYTEQGMLSLVEIRFDPVDGVIDEMKMRVVGTWIDKYRSQGKDHYAIIPLDENLEENESLKASGHYTRAAQAKEEIREFFSNITTN